MKNYEITTAMAQAAMNAGDMPDIGNAFAAINAAFEEMEEPAASTFLSAETLDRMADAFGAAWHAEDRERDGMSRSGDRRRAGLTEALKVLGIEVSQEWRKA